MFKTQHVGIKKIYLNLFMYSTFDSIYMCILGISESLRNMLFARITEIWNILNDTLCRVYRVLRLVIRKRGRGEGDCFGLFRNEHTKLDKINISGIRFSVIYFIFCLPTIMLCIATR